MKYFIGHYKFTGFNSNYGFNRTKTRPGYLNTLSVIMNSMDSMEIIDFNSKKAGRTNKYFINGKSNLYLYNSNMFEKGKIELKSIFTFPF